MDWRYTSNWRPGGSSSAGAGRPGAAAPRRSPGGSAYRRARPGSTIRRPSLRDPGPGSTRYHAPAGSSCLVEEDEEPPHEIDPEAKRAALLVAAALGSKVFEVLFVMRKIVIDGSNTSGFQRTILVSQGGALKVGRVEGRGPVHMLGGGRGKAGLRGERRAGSTTLTGWAFRSSRSPWRPAESGPREVKETALALGRLLRTTGIVSRGIGTIRQDVNVSLRGGSVVEIKGLQQLDQLERTIEYEAQKAGRAVHDSPEDRGGRDTGRGARYLGRPARLQVRYHPREPGGRPRGPRRPPAWTRGRSGLRALPRSEARPRDSPGRKIVRGWAASSTPTSCRRTG